MDITKISLDKLKKDKEDSLQDITVCKNVLAFGVRKYPGESIKERLDTNKKIVAKITAELKRRVK